MTNHSSFVLENKGRTCYFAVGAWLSNFGHGFSNPLGTFSLIKWNLYKNGETFWESGRRWEKMAAWWKYRLVVLCLK